MSDDDAKARGARVLDLLEAAGQKARLRPQREYPVVGGRIDMVWLWEGQEGFPSVLPLVGFEVESSWRTRKHIKGDYLNLLDLQPALGVIVLLGEGADVESTRSFAQTMIDRRPGRILIWSEADVERLATGAPDVVEDLVGENPSVQSAPTSHVIRHVGKYRALSAWLAQQQRSSIEVTFREIEEILGFPLPPSSRNHAAHWSSYEGSAVVRAIHDAGWLAKNVRLEDQRVTFERLPDR